MVLRGQCGEDRADSTGINLGVDLRGMVERRRREGRAAATPQGRADAAGACAAGALLLPRLLAAAAYFALGELSLGARATSRHVGADHLVDQRLVVLGAEDDVGNVQCVSAVMYLNIHGRFSPVNVMQIGRAHV